MPETVADNEQARRSAQLLLDAYRTQRDAEIQSPVPPFVKWFAGSVAAFGAAAIIGLGFWLVTSVSGMTQTLARMDERQIANASNLADRFETIDQRLARLEALKEAQ